MIDTLKIAKTTNNNGLKPKISVIYPDDIGNIILANAPALTKYPCNVPCGLRPTT